MEKSVLITGGSRGIGAAAVKAFAAAGWKTAFFYRENTEAAKRVSEETGAAAVRCDVSAGEEIAFSVKAARICLGVSAFDAVVLNAGVSASGLFTDMTDDAFSQVMNTNLYGAMAVAREALPAMISRKSGSVVTVSSIWGQTGASCEVLYSASKGAVIGFTKALAKEVGPSGIRVNCIAPGVIDTDMNSCYTKSDMAQLAQETALLRIGTPEEVADTALFLASDSASYITGQVIAVNGGLYI